MEHFFVMICAKRGPREPKGSLPIHREIVLAPEPALHNIEEFNSRTSQTLLTQRRGRGLLRSSHRAQVHGIMLLGGKG